jgi:nucleoporin NUP159
MQHQTSEVSTLKKRVATLDLPAALHRGSPSRDKRLPTDHSMNTRPRGVTPDVATATAAALNAERSAQKLKEALKMRKEVPLNTSVLLLPAGELAHGPPPGWVSVKKESAAPSPSPSGPSISVKNEEFEPSLQWSSPEHGSRDQGEQDQGEHEISGGRPHRNSRKHQKPVAMHASKGSPTFHAGSPTPPPAGFTWGPLPPTPTPQPGSGLPKGFVSLTKQ